jgi:hypothetical protein
MDSEERIEALHEISSDNDNYVKLSDGTKIGENLLTDLDRYFLLKIKLKKNENYSKNILNEVEKIKLNIYIDNINEDYKDYNLGDKIDLIKILLSGTIIKSKKKKIYDMITIYINNQNKSKEGFKKLLGDIIVELKKNKEYSFLEPTQLIETKKDIIKLENIFKNKTYSSFDNIVLLDKFNIFKQKYKRLKEDLRQEDDELINVMIEDIISKLKITYGIYDTTQKETKKITEEIYKKIGIDKQAVKDKKKEKEKEEANKKEEIQSTDIKILNQYYTYNDHRDEETMDNNKSINKSSYLKLYKLLMSENEKYIKRHIYNIIKDYKNNINNYNFYNYKNDPTKLLKHLKNILTIYSFNTKYDEDRILIIFITYARLYNSYKSCKFTKSLTDRDINDHSIKIYDSLLAEAKKHTYGTRTQFRIKDQQGGFEDKPNNKIEKEESPMLLEHYNSIKDIYIKLIISYYILICKIGGEENEIKIINNEDEDKHDDIIKDINIKKKDKDIDDKREKLEKEKKENENKNNQQYEDILTQSDYALLIKYREDESNHNKNIKKNNDRIKVLNDVLINITETLFELYIACNKIKLVPLITEYDENIHNILIDNNIYLFKDKNDKKRHLTHYILTDINKELSTLIKDNEERAQEIIKIRKNIADSQINERFNKGSNNGYYNNNNNNGYYNNNNNNENWYNNGNNQRRGFYGGGEDNTKLETHYKKLSQFLRVGDVGNGKDPTKEDLKDLVYQLKEDSNYNYYDNNGMNINNYNDNGEDKTIYENIWNQYMTGTHKPSKKNPLKNIEQGEILYNNVNEHNLVPEIVLGVNFQDKAIFVFLILIIRTIVMVFFELIIEYNLVKSLQYSIIIYSIIYLVLLVLSIGLVNYDSYKLRIVFNYLNVHINSSNLILHIILFIIFVSLIMIMIDSDDLIHNVGYLFDYTKIYVHIYENTMTQDKEIFYNILTRDEKIKLLYRLEIISMIIFIFSSFIILLL